ncbi:sigma-54-dependent transcriptional regulator [Hydrogenothermus marinus]|uniref:Two-component system nitrogen regulation response regulator GlnG n=1 Tax=Hydrogenothermus marinus TaxID=133270 RepID=A0A3M0B5P8_9AQUI|nr:sigma-54 dependent transcriptional regulator [Hydrogenothermus marinus]RMA92501.1 two-component system nitrogen regulation response regulator GlnG [Hydrogenothermus marinus]
MKALVFDDEKSILKAMKKLLEKENVEVKLYDSAKKALNIIKEESPDIVFLDISFKDSNGLEVLKQISKLEEKPYVVMISGYDEYNYLIEAMKFGAYDYIPKPFDVAKIKEIINDIKKSINKKSENVNAKSEIVGKSPAMTQVFKLVGRAAITDEPVLITGESGTGKEVIANLIHKFSNRSKNQFVAINCAAIPEDLIESELFGYEKGAFTGANTKKEGKFLLADKGSIFLDEISELPYNAQGKLLRVLQEKDVSPIGSNKTYKVDIKVIAATNKDLKKLVEEGKFREDLYYRLSVFEIYIPPLRERKEDIPELINLFTKQALKAYNLKDGGFTKEAINMLTNYSFPGNVRQLKNIVNRMISLYRERPITPELLPAEIKGNIEKDKWLKFLKEEINDLFILNKSENVYNNIVNKVEKLLIEEALNLTNNNISKASKLLGIHRNTIHKKIKELGIDKK